MATIEELVERYNTDPAFHKEVQDILADGRIAIEEIKTFAKKHNINISPLDLPRLIAKAKELGLL